MDIFMDISMDISMDIHIHGNPEHYAVGDKNSPLYHRPA